MGSKPQAPSFDFKKRFQHLADSDMNSDCEFIVGPQKTLIKGHKVIFSSASEVFQAMFFGNLREEKSVRVEDLDPDGFRGMKTFIYTGEVSFTSAFHALATYVAARKYIIAGLTLECVKYIHNHIKPLEVLEFLDRCKTNVIDEFDGLCIKIIQEKTDEVLASEYFVSTSIQTIELILKSPSLKLYSEIELYEHFERWALAEVQRQKIPDDCVSTRFNSLKKHFRFLTISSDEFVLKVAPSILLTQEEKLEIALNKMKFNAEMISNTISMTLQSRNFTINRLPSTYSSFNSQKQHHLKHMFKIRITGIENFSSNSSKPIRSYDHAAAHDKIILFKEQIPPENRYMWSSWIYYNQTENELSVHWSLFDEYLSFEAKSVHYTQKKELIIIKSKFRVLAVTGYDLFFENESRYIRCFDGNYSSEYQGNVILAVIPTSILKAHRFCIYYDDFIYIEGTFNVQQINL